VKNLTNLSKEKIQNKLPIVAQNLYIRELEREDIDNYANWPLYKGDKAMFNSSLKKAPIGEREKRWDSYQESKKSLSLVIDVDQNKTIGKFALVNIDWDKKTVGNMSIRLHPDYCDRGIGTLMLKEVIVFCFDLGIELVSLDVLASNTGAVKSYLNSGFEVIEEQFINDDKFLIMSVKNA
jgi:RimJ/RimL family protein N-acetyltransferase